MDSKLFKISITNPCANDWNEMQSVEDSSKFCLTCNKVVKDFTTMSDDEIKHYFITYKDKPTCGRFYKNQIENIRIEFQENILTSNIVFWQKFLMLFLVCFGQDLFAVEFSIAQTNNIDSTILQTDSQTVNTLIDSTKNIEDDSSIIDEPKLNKEIKINIDTTLFLPSIITGDYVIETNITTLGFCSVQPEPEFPTEPEINKVTFLSAKKSVNNHKNHITTDRNHTKKKKQGENDSNGNTDMLLVNNVNVYSRKKKRKPEN